MQISCLPGRIATSSTTKTPSIHYAVESHFESFHFRLYPRILRAMPTGLNLIAPEKYLSAKP